jgi:hypothetical protein
VATERTKLPIGRLAAAFGRSRAVFDQDLPRRTEADQGWQFMPTFATVAARRVRPLDRWQVRSINRRVEASCTGIASPGGANTGSASRRIGVSIRQPQGPSAASGGFWSSFRQIHRQ